MHLAFPITAAVLPSLLLIWFFYARDLRPEPRHVLAITFGLGVLIVVPVLIVGLPAMLFVGQLPTSFWQGAYIAFFCAAIPEEFFKYLVIRGYCARHVHFNEPMDGVVYGVVASLGFATLENVLYVAAGGWPMAIARAFTAVPMHAFLGAVLGYYVGQARFNRSALGTSLRGLLVAIMIHGLYDLGLLVVMQMALNREFEGAAPSERKALLVLALIGLSLSMLIVSGIWTLIIVHRLRREQMQEAKMTNDQGPNPYEQ